MANKRTAVVLTEANIGTEQNPIILHGKQLFSLIATTKIKCSLMCTEQGQGFDTFHGLTNRENGTIWEVRFVNAGKAELLIRNLHRSCSMFFKIKAYHPKQLQPHYLLFDATKMEIITVANKKPCITEIPSEDMYDYQPKENKEKQVTFPSIFRKDSDIQLELERLYPAFRQMYEKQSMENWFWFSLRRGCKMLYTFINFASVSMLQNRSQFGETALHVALRSTEPDALELVNLIIQMMGDSELLSLYDVAGMSAEYLATARGLRGVYIELACKNEELPPMDLRRIQLEHHDWIMKQLARYGAAHVYNGHKHNWNVLFGTQKFYLAAEFGLIEELQLEFDIDNRMKLNMPRALPENEVTIDGGMYAIHLAAQNGHIDVIEWLYSRGALLNVVDDSNDQPIHVAAKYGQVQAVEKFLSMGADIDAEGNLGRRVIHYAASYGQTYLIETLLDRGADINSADIFGWRPIDVARAFEFQDTVACLRQRGAMLEAGPVRQAIDFIMGDESIGNALDDEDEIGDEVDNYEDGNEDNYEDNDKDEHENESDNEDEGGDDGGGEGNDDGGDGGDEDENQDKGKGTHEDVYLKEYRYSSSTMIENTSANCQQ